MAHKSRYNIMIVPEDAAGADPVTLRVPGYFFRALAVAGAILVVLVAAGTYFTLRAHNDTVELPRLRAENERLTRVAAAVPRLETELEQYREFTGKVAALVGVSPPVFREMTFPQDTLHDSDSGGLAALTPGALPELPTSRLAFESAPLAAAIANRDTTNYPMGIPLRGSMSRGFTPMATNPAIRHFGIDIAARTGLPVYATAAGIVEFAGSDDELGLMIVIDHANGFKTIYGHNASLLVKAGTAVVRGSEIAASGNTGRSSAPHLHYEIRYGENALDPTLFFDARE